jgi:hypothetical protein
MKRDVNIIHFIIAIIPLLFTISLLSLFFIERANQGHWPDTRKQEAPPGLLRSISVFLYLAGYIFILVSVPFALIRYFFWQGNKPSLRMVIWLIVSISSMIVMVYLNPGHLFTWMMG